MPFAHHHRDSNAGLTRGHLLIHHTVLLFPGHGPHCGPMDLRQVRTQEQEKTDTTRDHGDARDNEREGEGW